MFRTIFHFRYPIDVRLTLWCHHVSGCTVVTTGLPLNEEITKFRSTGPSWGAPPVGAVDSAHKGPVIQKASPCHDRIQTCTSQLWQFQLHPPSSVFDQNVTPINIWYVLSISNFSYPVGVFFAQTHSIFLIHLKVIRHTQIIKQKGKGCQGDRSGITADA